MSQNSSGRQQHVLVVGASGFLGSALAGQFRKEGGCVSASSRTSGDPETACDLQRPEQIRVMLDRVQPAVVVNCAVVADFSAGSLSRQYAVNVLAPAVMAQWCAERGTHLVQISGSLVCSARAAMVGPDTPVNPDTDYGRAKWLAEQMIEASGCRAAVLRFGGIYGLGGPRHLGLNRALDGAMSGQVPVLTGEGTGKRNYVHVDDAAGMIVHAVRHQLTGTHLAAGAETLSIRDMLQTVCDVLLPGTTPVRQPGFDTSDTIVASSPHLPASRPLREVLKGLQKG
jgi:nucleoside-diphosphate-sugar epimerase